MVYNIRDIINILDQPAETEWDRACWDFYCITLESHICSQRVKWINKWELAQWNITEQCVRRTKEFGTFKRETLLTVGSVLISVKAVLEVESAARMKIWSKAQSFEASDDDERVKLLQMLMIIYNNWRVFQTRKVRIRIWDESWMQSEVFIQDDRMWRYHFCNMK
jgi:hypothetical protein